MVFFFGCKCMTSPKSSSSFYFRSFSFLLNKILRIKTTRKENNTKVSAKWELAPSLSKGLRQK